MVILFFWYSFDIASYNCFRELFLDIWAKALQYLDYQIEVSFTCSSAAPFCLFFWVKLSQFSLCDCRASTLCVLSLIFVWMSHLPVSILFVWMLYECPCVLNNIFTTLGLFISAFAIFLEEQFWCHYFLKYDFRCFPLF